MLVCIIQIKLTEKIILHENHFQNCLTIAISLVYSHYLFKSHHDLQGKNNIKAVFIR